MIDHEKMIEALAKAIRDNLPATRAMDEFPAEIATAVLELVKPKRLVWQRNGNHWAGGRGYVIRKMSVRTACVLTIRNQHPQHFETLKAAQAAAQAHADAAHWGNTQLGDLIGGAE